MQSLDYAVLLGYLALMAAVGVVLSARNSTTDEMFGAGGRSPWWVSGLSGFMTMFSAGTFVVWGGIAFRLGVVAIAINLCYGVAALVAGATVAGRWKRLGVRTPAEYVEVRFGRASLHFFTWAMMAYRVIGGGVALYAMALVLTASMPLADGNPLQDPATGNLSLPLAIVIFGGVVSLYTMAGGLWGVLVTDTIQFMVLNIAVIYLVVVTLMQPTDWPAAISQAPAGFFYPTAAIEGYTAFFLTGWVILHFFVIGAEWAFVQRYICVATEKDARKSAYLFGVLYLVSPFLWLLPPFLHRLRSPVAASLEGRSLIQAGENAYVEACVELLPTGMLGLMVAAMFSATASMLSSQLNVFAGVFTEDLVRRWMRRDLSERWLVAVGRLFTLVLGAAFIGIALTVPYLGGAERVVVTATTLVVTPLLAPSLFGLFSDRLRSSSVWWTAGVGGTLGLTGKFVLADELVAGATGWRDTVAAWVAAHPRTFDLILGLVIPLVVLAIVHRFSPGVADGWRRIERLANHGDRSHPDPRLSAPRNTDAPAWCLVASGLATGIVALLSSAASGYLLAISAALCAAGGWMLLSVRRPTCGSGEGELRADV